MHPVYESEALSRYSKLQRSISITCVRSFNHLHTACKPERRPKLLCLNTANGHHIDRQPSRNPLNDTFLFIQSIELWCFTHTATNQSIEQEQGKKTTTKPINYNMTLNPFICIVQNHFTLHAKPYAHCQGKNNHVNGLRRIQKEIDRLIDGKNAKCSMQFHRVFLFCLIDVTHCLENSNFFFLWGR